MFMVKMRSVVALVGLAMLVTLAVGGPASAATRGVSEVDFEFVPATVTVAVGDTVIWTNNGASPHTSTGGSWNSGQMNPGDTFSHTFNSAGTFPYVCQFHESQGMVGTVIVQAGGGGGGGGTLPSTGLSDATVPFVWVGLLFLVVGGVVLYVLRRRRA
jgi:LPXTG-motif cell wall-anchored protein